MVLEKSASVKSAWIKWMLYETKSSKRSVQVLLSKSVT
jgi:hypothetical protein